MSTDDMTQSGGGAKRTVHTWLAAAVAFVGLLLLIYMIVWEDEPGAVPLLLIALGIGWLVVARVRLRPRRG